MTKLIFFLVLSFVAFGFATPPSQAQVSVGIGVGIHVGPPVLPVYAQPVCPGVGYMWTPGYWAYGSDGYFWVPGTWVLAPTPGYLWTPGYWGWGGGGYFWHAGYWGPHVGFYGGINYGFGYVGSGFYGGQWIGGAYHYNTAVTNVNTTVVNNTYNTTVANNNTTVNRTSYNGGTGGVTAQPTAAEQAAANEPHTAPTVAQTQHQQAASTNRAMLASENHGTPAVAATPKPGAFSGPGIVAAKPASAVAENGSHPGANEAKSAAVQNDRPPSARTSSSPAETSPNTTGTSNSSNVNHPTTSGTPTNTTKPQTTQSNSSKPNTSHPSTTKGNSHPNYQKPKPQSHPAEPHGGKGR
ncbi:MAG: hypothetical protein WAK20_05980 [Candidatus Acidiferrum sp.]